MNRISRLQGVRRSTGISVAAMVAALSMRTASAQEPAFLRGDVNGDGAVTISDGSYLVRFRAGLLESPACLKSADINDDGKIDWIDPSKLNEFLTQRVLPVPCAPYPAPGTDPTPDGLGCESASGGGPVEDSEARLDVQVGPADEEGRVLLTLVVSSSRAVHGLELTLTVDGNILGGGGTAGHRNLVRDRLDPDRFEMGWATARTMADGRFIFAFVSGVGPGSDEEGRPIGDHLAPSDSRPLAQTWFCLLQGTPAGRYEVHVEHAEFADFETGRPIYPRVTVEEVVVEEDLTGEQGCAPSDSVEPAACVIPPEPIDPAPLGADFLRGDANTDGRVSISDALAIRRYLFNGGPPFSCDETADIDGDGLHDVSDVVRLLSGLFLGGAPPVAPFPEVGPGSADDALGCAGYAAIEPAVTEDLVDIGEVTAARGQVVAIPVYLTSALEIEAVQVLIAYDPALLETQKLSFTGSYYDMVQRVAHPFKAAKPIADGILAVGFIPELIEDKYSIPPGDGQLIFNIVARISENAAPGTTIDLVPTNGPDDQGVGIARMRNELTHKGEARFVTTLPRTLPGHLQIVGDLAIFTRGDSNSDGAVDLSDAAHALGYLFLGETRPRCLAAADVDDDGKLDIADPVNLLAYLFLGGTAPQPPFPSPGIDPTPDGLGCEGR